ncbi:hypothetical protein AWM75_04285 [Aerococcus urinaehominis]|uniref:Uncharacterized protein n=1 Tax=Aerococcus urinaehominis TaxID=128944 RepID=A0A109RGL7_9LACT|nr:sigma-70 family RNA polymerase sigma factor [Aerococcus urinaehominis]AMB99266.1 hypothetical protein AWM75_04285 [Aerococcus urinaehominis]SDM47107.1 regulatory protein, luxR family [Aerococcus urinaehominis]
MVQNNEELFYKALSDKDLIKRWQNGDEEAFRTLARRYLPLAYAASRSYRIQLMDSDDYIQELLVSLNKATKEFKVNSDVSFAAFIKRTYHNRMVDLVRAENAVKRLSDKHKSYLEDKFPDGCWHEHLLTPSASDNPENRVIIRESYAEYRQALSELERLVFDLSLAGKTVKEIASQLSCSVSQVSRAQQRCRLKRLYYFD